MSFSSLAMSNRDVNTVRTGCLVIDDIFNER